jgi:hypothetical protein
VRGFGGKSSRRSGLTCRTRDPPLLPTRIDVSVNKDQNMSSLYRAVMDSSVNPLRTLPAAQRFQIMLFLSVMWTNIFCLSVGAWMWYGELIVFHGPSLPAGVDDVRLSHLSSFPPEGRHRPL